MKILFQGSYNAKRDPKGNRLLVIEYTKRLARKVIENDQHIVTTYLRDTDKILAEEICRLLDYDAQRIKRHLTYYLPDKLEEHPPYGIVRRFQTPDYWASERTLAVAFCDALMVIGGGRGTADSMEKAFLSQKPIFIAYQIKGYPTEVWDIQAHDYFYLEPGDADFITDGNLSTEEFFDHSFAIIDQLESAGQGPIDDQPEKARSMVFPFLELRQLVAKGYIDRALKRSLDFANTIDQGLANQLTTLSGSYHIQRRSRSMGITEKNEQLNRIMLAFLEILTEIEEMDFR
ncbi:MAG: hypothetical protein KDC54_24875 [Lewinella sp.]|nr:hypothetical protein [Lewinella sp.]